MSAGDNRNVSKAATAHPLARLKTHTDARIALGRAGAGLPTAAHLDFAEAHARARDAVHTEFDADRIASELETADLEFFRAASQTADRAEYLKRPDLGRKLSDESRDRLEATGGEGFDLVLVIADGLSAKAVNTYAVEVTTSIVKRLPDDWRLAPIVIASGARVALSDPIGEALGAKIALMLIGERPGLSAADSVGAYLTFGPKPGRTDAERNCVSNIRQGGLTPNEAAVKLAGLLQRSMERGLSGTRLKDDSDDLLHPSMDRRIGDEGE